jgi:hypothetical protein
MTNSAQFPSPRYNRLKKRALEVFARHAGWLTPRQWAAMAGFYPVRAAYSYLLRLHRFGLLERKSVYRGSLRYRLSNKGKQRLSWLAQSDREHRL